jgi:spermidine synthase
MIRALYFLFVLSGAAGLIYESTWTRYLGLFVGHDAYAQIIVLVIFLGGMSTGAMAVSRWSARLKEPLSGYVAIELVVGCIGLVFHDAFQATTGWAYHTVYPPLAGSWALIAAKWSIAAALILPQSVLLGATFPLMSAGVLRLQPVRPGRKLAILYFSGLFSQRP